MCGIAGILGAIEPDDVSRVHAMDTTQRHRGPDAEACRSVPGAVLGHTRLSVIDLSDRAGQPMTSSDGRYTIVFNGEIYNYKELRRELERHMPFRSDSDTEVLLAAWTHWGDRFLERMNGMFAFCIYDALNRSAFLARDRFGQKPLYIVEQPDRLLFASEVKALLAAGVPAKPDLDAWSRYLAAASYDDGSDTFFSGISQLEPGECATWSQQGGLRRTMYYRVLEHVAPLSLDVETAARHLRELMVDVGRIHMRSDVPVAISLSGGLDSSALLACLDLGGALSDRVACLSVEFGNEFSERKWIEAAAGYHGLHSDIHTFDVAAFRGSIEPMIRQAEGPLGGLMNCALGEVMKMAESSGYIVVQDGSGLDEAFGGYRNHHGLYVGTLLQSGSRLAREALRDYATNWQVDEETARKAAMAELTRSGSAIDGTTLVRPEFLAPGVLERGKATLPPSPTNAEEIRVALADYLQVRKIPRNTRMKDRMSMALGIELRLPFLDHNLVEFALSLPAAHYFHDGATKAIVRMALDGAMDDDVRTARKRSIQAPQGKWLAMEPMKSYVRDLLDSESFGDRGLFDANCVRRAFASFCETGASNSFFIWQWINVEGWFRAFIDSAPTISDCHAAGAADTKAVP
jgi:asparagine synthase (glutamine-hydrolysing)